MIFRLFPSHLISFRSSSLLAVGLVTTGLAISSCSFASDSASSTMSKSGKMEMAQHAAMTHELTVFRSPTCGCCGKWVEHMKAEGFNVKDEITEDVDAIKEQYGLPETLASCHTAIADGYVIEGHIPAEDVQRLLMDKPDIAGIAVPGMPIGSPGMESGDYVEPYSVFSFTEDGSTEAFAEHS